MAGPEAQVPQSLQERGEGGSSVRNIGRPIDQKKKVHIGVRKQLAAAIPTHGQQGQPSGKILPERFLESLSHRRIHGVSAVGQKSGGVARGEELFPSPIQERATERILHGRHSES